MFLRLGGLLLALFFFGCATASSWVPCPNGVTFDAHQTWGDYKDRRNGFEEGEPHSNRVRGDFESLQVGGALHAELGRDFRTCPTLGGRSDEE